MEKINLYLDNCCFNRPYDDQSQLTVKLETEAKYIKKIKVLSPIEFIIEMEEKR